jgi:peptide/nickel transport system permease protein
VLRYVIKRLLWAVVLLLLISFVTFLLFTVIPDDPARLAAGPNASSDDIERVQRALGLDRPVYVQYAKFIWRLVGEHSLGRSFATGEDVNDVVLNAAPVTASVVLGGVLLLLLVSIPTGTFSALRPRSPLDRLFMVYMLVGVSVPTFWVGLILAYVVGFKLGWTPIGGYCDFINPPPKACGGPAAWASHLVLPWAVIGFHYAALYSRMVRATVMETLTAEYVRAARARGAPERRVLTAHVLRNSMLPIVTMLGMDVGHLLGGAFFVEAVFGLPGLGREAVNAAAGTHDYPITEGIVLFGAATVVLLNLITDLAYIRLDPRIAIQTRR